MALTVGFFDSGIGGKCILEAFRRLCPDVDTVYLADSANCPYGNKSAEEIFRLSDACVGELLERGCRIIVIACNTATAAAIDRLRRKYPDVPFIGMEPALKPAALASRTKIVGVPRLTSPPLSPSSRPSPMNSSNWSSAVKYQGKMSSALSAQKSSRCSMPVAIG